MRSLLILLAVVGFVAANPQGGNNHKLSASKLIAFLTKACDNDFMTEAKTEELLACSSNQGGRQMMRTCVTQAYEVDEQTDKMELRQMMCEDVSKLVQVGGCMKRAYQTRKEQNASLTREEANSQLLEKRMCIRRVMELSDEN